MAVSDLRAADTPAACSTASLFKRPTWPQSIFVTAPFAHRVRHAALTGFDLQALRFLGRRLGRRLTLTALQILYGSPGGGTGG